MTARNETMRNEAKCNQNPAGKKAGVLFCGGCNPTYDRERLYRQLERYYETRFTYEFYEEAGEYDLLLIINGCSSECLITQPYQTPVICLDSGDINIAVQKIENLSP